MLGYLSADIICSEKRTVFRERSSRKTVSYEKNRYISEYISPQIEAIVLIILQIFSLARDWSKRVSEQIVSADKYPSIFSRQMATIVYLYNNQINARVLIGQAAVGYCAGKPTEKSPVF